MVRKFLLEYYYCYLNTIGIKTNNLIMDANLMYLDLTGCACRSGLILTNDCACPGNNLIFECTVVGVAGGTTQWKGDAIRSCSVPVILLRHRDFITGTTQPVVCNGGEIIIRSLRVESDCYTSQMNISFGNTLINRMVVSKIVHMAMVHMQLTLDQCLLELLINVRVKIIPRVRT